MQIPQISEQFDTFLPKIAPYNRYILCLLPVLSLREERGILPLIAPKLPLLREVDFGIFRSLTAYFIRSYEILPLRFFPY